MRKILILAATLGLGFAIYLGVNALIEKPSEEERAALDRLEPRAKEYAAAEGVPTPGRPHLTGRIVPMSTDQDEIDEGVFIRLPGELQARSPKEVSFVVLIDYEQKAVFQYEDGADALQDFAYLTIVNLVSGKQFKGKAFGGSEPEFVKSGGGDTEGGPVDKGNIADYLARLSQKPSIEPPQSHP